MMSEHTSYVAGFQRSQKDNLTVLLLRRLRRETLTAEEATKNSRPVGILSAALLGAGFFGTAV